MSFMRSTGAGFFRALNLGEAAVALRAVPDLDTRIPFPIVGPRLLGVFYLTLEQARLAGSFQSKGLGPFPALMTTDPIAAIGIDIKASNFFFGENRAEGRALRISAGASMTVWRHVQVFMNQGKKMSYPVDLGFVLGIAPAEKVASIQERLLDLFENTLEVWRRRESALTR